MVSAHCQLRKRKRYFCRVVTRTVYSRGEAHLGSHVAAWNYTRLEERAARLVGVGDRTFCALGDCDDDYAALACFAEGGHQIFALRRVSRAERFEDDASDGGDEEGLDCGGGNAWK